MGILDGMTRFAAAQGVDYRLEDMKNDPKLGRGTQAAYDLIRSRVPFLEADTVMYPHMYAVRDLVASGALVAAVEEALKT